MALKIQTRVERIPSPSGPIEVGVVACSGRLVYGEESFMCRDSIKLLLGEAGRVVMDLSQVPYIDSGGLGTLVGLLTSARNAGGDIKLVGPSKRVADLLNMTRLVAVFESFANERDAFAAFLPKANATSA